MATFSGDSNNASVTSGTTAEPVTISSAERDCHQDRRLYSDLPGQTAGYTVTITNTGTSTASGITLSYPLPAGKGGDIVWSIDTTTDTPSDFTITGSKGSQQLVLSSTFTGTAKGDGDDSLAAGQSISVHITAMTYADDAAASCTTTCSIGNNFNGTSVSAGDYLWFNCAVNCTGLSSSVPTTVCFTGQTISFTCGSQNYTSRTRRLCHLLAQLQHGRHQFQRRPELLDHQLRRRALGQRVHLRCAHPGAHRRHYQQCHLERDVQRRRQRGRELEVDGLLLQQFQHQLQRAGGQALRQ